MSGLELDPDVVDQAREAGIPLDVVLAVWINTPTNASPADIVSILATAQPLLERRKAS